MAVVLPGKFIYLATPYTGSMACTRALKKIPGAFVAQDKRRGVGHHARLEDVKRVAADELTGTEAVIVAVRNPYDVFVSWYLRNLTHFQVKHLVKIELNGERDPTLREFLELWLEADMFPYMAEGRVFYHAEDGGRRVRRIVVRHENLEASLNAALREISAPVVKLGRENATPDKDHWSTYYDDATYAFVNERFQEDFVKFGYSFRW